MYNIAQLFKIVWHLLHGNTLLRVLSLRVFFKCSIINVASQNNQGRKGIFQTASHSQQRSHLIQVHMDSRSEMLIK